MSKLSALVSIAALAGVGYYVAKKLIDKRNAEEEERASHVYEDDSEVFVQEVHSDPKEKLRRAGMFAVGSIKTGAEKIKEGLDEMIDSDMVSKGEEAFEKTKAAASETADKAVNFAKSAGESIKENIDNIKAKVIQKTDDVAQDSPAADLAEAIEKDVDDLANSAPDMAQAIQDPEAIVREIANEHQNTVDHIAEAAEEALEQANDEISAAADDIDSISVDSFSSDSVETFDFSKPSDNNML